MSGPKYRRILLKLSGESFSGEGGYGLSDESVAKIASEIRSLHSMGLETAVVVGGGNIFRGHAASERGMSRSTADAIGMLGTIINGLALQERLERDGVPARLLSAIEVNKVCEPYIRRRAVRHLEKKRVVIFAAGTGNPYFTTDTAASLRAAEIDAELIIKATKVDGVYDKDPKVHSDAKKFDTLTFMKVISGHLGVMDATAATMCMENNIPIVVLNMSEDGALIRAVRGERVGTWIGRD